MMSTKPITHLIIDPNEPIGVVEQIDKITGFAQVKLTPYFLNKLLELWQYENR